MNTEMAFGPTEQAAGISVQTIVRVSAWLGAAMVVGMTAIFFATGIGQDPLQYIHPVDEYTGFLLRNPAALRATIGLDNFFIVFYTSVFIALGALLMRAGSTRLLVQAFLGSVLLLALLDMAENFHFLTMLARAELHVLPTNSEINLQVWETLLKFHVGYLGAFLLGLAIPRQTRAARVLANLCLFVQLPAGILIYVTPSAVALPLVFVRLTFFVVALLLIASVFGGSEPQTV